MTDEIKEILVKKIKDKKQISNLENSFIEKILEQYILTNGDIYKKLKLDFEKNPKIEKNKYFKEILKKVRKEIGILYGSFLKRDFDKLNNSLNLEFEEVLKLHKSTNERYEFYEEIYSKIFKFHKANKIADLACGLNPISYAFIEKELSKKIEYKAYDLNPNDMNFINSYSKKHLYKITAKAKDITELEILDEISDCDLLFLFKALDSFETLKRDISKELLEKVKINKIVVSFPTKSIVSKKDFKIEKRNWFFNFLKKKNWDYETFEVENELFILITKN